MSCLYRAPVVVTAVTYTKSFVVGGARPGVVGWGTALQAGKPRVRFPMVSLEFFNVTVSNRS